MLFLGFDGGNKNIIKTIKSPSCYEIRDTQGTHEFSSGTKFIEYVVAPKHKIGRVVLITRRTLTTQLFSGLRTRNLDSDFSPDKRHTQAVSWSGFSWPLLIGKAGSAVTAQGSCGAGPPEQFLHAAVPTMEEPMSVFVVKLQLESN